MTPELREPWGLEDLPGEVRRRIVARLRRHEPAAIGILVQGSYARRSATSSSDLDMVVLVETAGDVAYRTWFEELPRADSGSADDRDARHAQGLLHVSAKMNLTPADWERKKSSPCGWAFGFPVTQVYVWVEAGERGRELLGDEPVLVRPGEPSIEDMVETATKVRRAIAAGDGDLLRFCAHDLVRYTAANLVPLNEPVVVHDPYEALAAMLALKRAPDGWEADVRICLALDPANDEGLASAATRLPLGVLTYVREHHPGVDPTPWVEQYVRDGTFERYLRGA